MSDAKLATDTDTPANATPVEAHCLDVRKLLCPLPVIRVQQKIQTLKEGDCLLVLATDPGVQYDIPAWCRIHGHIVQSIEQVAKEIHLRIAIQN